jgi:hypothetical protein
MADPAPEAMIIDAHLPSMTARFRIPPGLPLGAGLYELRSVRSPTAEDVARWAHLPDAPIDGDEERDLVVGWLQTRAHPAANATFEYRAGWRDACRLAAEQILRGEHIKAMEDDDDV